MISKETKAYRDLIMKVTREAMKVWEAANGYSVSQERIDFINQYISERIPENIREKAI